MHKNIDYIPLNYVCKQLKNYQLNSVLLIFLPQLLDRMKIFKMKNNNQI